MSAGLPPLPPMYNNNQKTNGHSQEESKVTRAKTTKRQYDNPTVSVIVAELKPTQYGFVATDGKQYTCTKASGLQANSFVEGSEYSIEVNEYNGRLYIQKIISQVGVEKIADAVTKTQSSIPSKETRPSQADYEPRQLEIARGKTRSTVFYAAIQSQAFVNIHENAGFEEAVEKAIELSEIGVRYSFTGK